MTKPKPTSEKVGGVYHVEGYVCGNCGWSGSIDVRCGELRPEVVECPVCRCVTARKNERTATFIQTVLPLGEPVERILRHWHLPDHRDIVWMSGGPLKSGSI